MCSFASNAIGSHAAPLRATLLNFFSKNIFRNRCFGTRRPNKHYKGIPTKWYTFSLYESAPSTPAAPPPARSDSATWATHLARHRRHVTEAPYHEAMADALNIYEGALQLKYRALQRVARLA